MISESWDNLDLSPEKNNNKVSLSPVSDEVSSGIEDNKVLIYPISDNTSSDTSCSSFSSNFQIKLPSELLCLLNINPKVKTPEHFIDEEELKKIESYHENDTDQKIGQSDNTQTAIFESDNISSSASIVSLDNEYISRSGIEIENEMLYNETLFGSKINFDSDKYDVKSEIKCYFGDLCQKAKKIIQDFSIKIRKNKIAIISYTLKGIIVGGCIYCAYKKYNELNNRIDRLEEIISKNSKIIDMEKNMAYYRVTKPYVPGKFPSELIGKCVVRSEPVEYGNGNQHWNFNKPGNIIKSVNDYGLITLERKHPFYNNGRKSSFLLDQRWNDNLWYQVSMKYCQ